MDIVSSNVAPSADGQTLNVTMRVTDLSNPAAAIVAIPGATGASRPGGSTQNAPVGLQPK